MLADESSDHWAYERLSKPDLPELRNSEWGRNGIDAFILAKLKREGLEPGTEADQETLIRRVTLDLLGLPPTLEEVDAFLADESPDAYERLIDRLLTSPHYGERWGRHWLDVARYIQGTIKVDGIDRIDMAEPYRDYVVRSFNQGKPYDRFIAEQVAGDLLPKPTDRQAYVDQIVAPAFLSIGPWFDECTDPNQLRLDIIDEQISTLTRAIIGLDFACARCHDHKFDPIPTRDYYAMAGIFRSTKIVSEFSEMWRDGRPRLTRYLATEGEKSDARKIEVQIEALKSQRWVFLKAERDRLIAEVAKLEADYRAALDSRPPLDAATWEAEDYAGQRNLRGFPDEDGPVIGTRKRQDQWAKYYVEVPSAGRYQLSVRYAAAEAFSVNVEINGRLQAEGAIHEATGGWDSAYEAWKPAGTYEFHRGRNLIRLLAQRHEWFPRLDQLRLTKVEAALPAEGLDPRVLEFRRNHPDAWPPTIAETEGLLGEPTELVKLDARLDDLTQAIANQSEALAVIDAEPRDLPVHIGGQVYQTEEEEVPRGVPSLGGLEVSEVPPDESGREQLAEWLTHTDNPLTARVMANRVWHWHFGRGLVKTTADFGIQGALPTHPELLDWLAAEFIESGWSIQALHRLILTSATYRLSSANQEWNERIDPDNQLQWRYPRRRLEVEAIYDSMLSSIGKVPRQPSGQPLDLGRSKDRALYILTSGRSPMGLGQEIRKMFPLFGFDESGVPMHERSTAETPAQALFWLNNPLPQFYAEKFAERLLATPNLEEAARIELAFRIALGTRPTPLMIAKTRQYLEFCRSREGLSEPEAWKRICLGIYSSEAFRYLE